MEKFEQCLFEESHLTTKESSSSRASLLANPKNLIKLYNLIFKKE